LRSRCVHKGAKDKVCVCEQDLRGKPNPRACGVLYKGTFGERSTHLMHLLSESPTLVVLEQHNKQVFLLVIFASHS